MRQGWLCALACFMTTLSLAASTETEQSKLSILDDPRLVQVPDFKSSVANFNGNNQIFNQHSYEETIKSQAEILVALEALGQVITDLQLDVAHIEDVVYGNSKDVHDNVEDVAENSENGGNNRHTFAGM